MEKERLKDSDRFKVFLHTAIFEVLLLGAGWASTTYGWEIPIDLLEKVALTVGGLAVTFIASRTYRNTPAT